MTATPDDRINITIRKCGEETVLVTEELLECIRALIQIKTFKLKKSKKIGIWSARERLFFLKGVHKNGMNWSKIAETVGSREVRQCISHYQHINEKRMDVITYANSEYFKRKRLTDNNTDDNQLKKTKT